MTRPCVRPTKKGSRIFKDTRIAVQTHKKCTKRMLPGRITGSSFRRAGMWRVYQNPNEHIAQFKEEEEARGQFNFSVVVLKGQSHSILHLPSDGGGIMKIQV
jgi:hypothetical protein